ncbi:MAG: transcriptional regulator [Candidatus Helarchaeota archaeon]
MFENQWKTRRQKIYELLLNAKTPLSIEQIVSILEITEKKLVFEDLYHIEKSLSSQNKKLIIIYPQCQICGFIFKKKFKHISKCPKCKRNRINSPSFRIKNR